MSTYKFHTVSLHMCYRPQLCSSLTVYVTFCMTPLCTFNPKASWIYSTALQMESGEDKQDITRYTEYHIRRKKHGVAPALTTLLIFIFNS